MRSDDGVSFSERVVDIMNEERLNLEELEKLCKICQLLLENDSEQIYKEMRA